MGEARRDVELLSTPYGTGFLFTEQNFAPLCDAVAQKNGLVPRHGLVTQDIIYAGAGDTLVERPSGSALNLIQLNFIGKISFHF